MSGRYAPVEVQVDGLWECTDCAALVSDRQRHDEAAHGEWGATIPPRRYDSPTVPNRQYTVGEQGPELFSPNRQESVIPNPEDPA